MKIDLTCPVELWHYALPTETDAECTFVMNNLSDKVVTSVQVTLNCFDAAGELILRQTERMQGLKAGVGERFSVMLLPSEWNGVAGVDLVIEKVWFDDATIWRRGNAPLTEYMPNALPAGRPLDELRFVAGKDAVGYPQLQEYVWMCVCGRANAPESQRCCRCERRRDAVFASFSRENVSHVIAAHESKLAQAARKAREENNILQENQEKQRAAKRRRRNNLIRWTTTLALLAAAAVIVFAWVLPSVRYDTAADLLAGGHYDEAKAAFSQMDTYRDAQTQVLECDYQKADALYAKGEAEAMEQAEKLFAALKEYSDSAERALQVRYDLGCLYLEQANYELAVEKFQTLGQYQDSADKLNETIYRQADAMLLSGSYEAARVLFAGLGDYSDAQEQVNECSYRMAEEKLDAGEYQTAISMFVMIEDYADAADRIGECYYALAEQEIANQSYESAGEWFLMAGSYSDAQNRANESFYQLARSKREAGEYEEAIALFLRAPEYLDSEDMAQLCVYEMAYALKRDGDLDGALALFESIAAYDGAQEQLDECRYLMAQEALDNGETQQAEALLEMIVDYKGAETQLKKVRYQLAQEAMDSGDYQTAVDRYEMLGTYKDSRTKIKQARYGLANAALAAGQYEQAIELFAELGSYRDSKSLLKDARYQQAMAMKDEDAAGAMELLKEIGGSEADEALEQLRMEEAARLEAAGDYEQAAQHYAAITGNAEAQERYQACRYQLAVQLRQRGDLPGAAAAFAALDDYQDAQEQSEACYSEYYGQVAQTAREAAQQQDAAGVIAALRDFDLNVFSDTYSDLPELFNQACMQIGEQLYADGRPYEAIPYYQRAGDEEKLERRAYLILGEWKSATGKTAAFRADGTCDLMGEELYFRVSNFSLYTGTDPENMTITHKISVLDRKGMSLRDQRNDQDVLYKLSRVGSFELPLMELPQPAQEETEPAETEPVETPAPSAEPTLEPAATPEPEASAEQDEVEEMLVTEDEDAADE